MLLGLHLIMACLSVTNAVLDIEVLEDVFQSSNLYEKVIGHSL